jgi:hypothetical protein
MGVPLYMDVHVPGAITRQLRRRGVDVLTAQEDGHDTVVDDDVLARAIELGRLLFTHDVRFRVLAEDWQRQGREFAGLAFGAQLGGTIGQYTWKTWSLSRRHRSHTSGATSCSFCRSSVAERELGKQQCQMRLNAFESCSLAASTNTAKQRVISQIPMNY